MKIKGFTQIGLLTAMSILFLQLILYKFNLQSSGWLALEYVFLWLGVFIAIFLYNRNNALVTVDLFMIGFRTVGAAVALIFIGQVLFYFTVLKGVENLKFTFLIQRVLLPLVFSGMISSFVCAIIVNKLLTKK